MINRLNIRVYGILKDNDNHILIVDEQIGDFKFTKFPGGGLELGEGTIACLEREFMEECNLAIEVKEHIYTTDFFQPSAFKLGDQLIAIYYAVEAKNKPISLNLNPIEITENGKTEKLQFKWLAMKDLHTDIFTFPIDKLVCDMLKNK